MNRSLLLVVVAMAFFILDIPATSGLKCFQCLTDAECMAAKVGEAGKECADATLLGCMKELDADKKIKKAECIKGDPAPPEECKLDGSPMKCECKNEDCNKLVVGEEYPGTAPPKVTGSPDPDKTTDTAGGDNNTGTSLRFHGAAGAVQHVLIAAFCLTTAYFAC